MGSWLLYGLGSESQNLPGFMVLDAHGADPAQWGSSFLPAAYQGTRIDDLKKPIANLGNGQVPASQQRRQLDLVQRLNQLYRHDREDDTRLDARIQSFELAFRMQ